MNPGHESIGKWLSMLHRCGRIYIEKELKSYNIHIGRGQFIFLMMLYKEDGISQENLSNNLNIDKGTTARAIKKLEKEGYIIRKVDPDDKRAYRVYITEKALEIKPIIKKILHDWTDVLSSDFTEEETVLILKLLKRMAENVVSFIEEKDED